MRPEAVTRRLKAVGEMYRPMTIDEFHYSASQARLRGRPSAALTTESSPDATLHQLGRKRLFESKEGVTVRRFHGDSAPSRDLSPETVSARRFELAEILQLTRWLQSGSSNVGEVPIK